MGSMPQRVNEGYLRIRLFAVISVALRMFLCLKSFPAFPFSIVFTIQDPLLHMWYKSGTKEKTQQALFCYHQM
jgi:hypothetical protein